MLKILISYLFTPVTSIPGCWVLTDNGDEDLQMSTPVEVLLL